MCELSSSARMPHAGSPPTLTGRRASDLLLCCAPGRIRTCDTRFRRAVLYPLSYEGWDATVAPPCRPGYRRQCSGWVGSGSAGR